MNQAKSLILQKQIMDNSKSLNEYYKDFDGWVNEMNQKEKIVQQLNSTKPIQPGISSTNTNQPDSIKEKETDQSKTKNNHKYLKRDKNSIRNYYDEWDKINPEEDLIDVESSITINSSSNSANALYQDKKTSSAKENMNISIVNNRCQFSLSVDNQIERLKNEANENFAFKNYTKSIELYSSAIKLIKSPDDKSILIINLFNNRGNAQMKIGNYKQAVTDFDATLNIDKSNIKALFRRGTCYLNLNQLNHAYNDLYSANCLSQDNEKETIQSSIDQVISLMNSRIIEEKKKMEDFIYKENEHFIQVRINDIQSSQMNTRQNENDTPLFESISQKDFSPSTIQVGKMQIKKVKLNKEEIQQFVYDITKDNLTSSSFKYAYRNLGSIEEKKEYLVKVNPNSLPQIFKSDLDNNTFLDIIKCLKLIENKIQIIDYLRGLSKVNRIDIIIKLNQKKSKAELMDLFDILEKSDLNSEVIPLKDFYLH